MELPFLVSQRKGSRECASEGLREGKALPELNCCLHTSPRKSLLSTLTTTSVPPLTLFHTECVQQVIHSDMYPSNCGLINCANKMKWAEAEEYAGLTVQGCNLNWGWGDITFQILFWGAGVLGGKAQCPDLLSKVSPQPGAQRARLSKMEETLCTTESLWSLLSLHTLTENWKLLCPCVCCRT